MRDGLTVMRGGLGIKLNIVAEVLYQWESAAFRMFDESRRILAGNSAVEAKKDELFDAMLKLSKQRKVYDKLKSERDTFTKYRNSLESKASLLSELRELFIAEYEDWKGLNEWQSILDSVIETQKYLLTNCLFAAGVLFYFGPFTYFSRINMRNQWIEVFRNVGFEAQDEPKIEELLGTPEMLAEWSEKQLLRDSVCLENAFILNNAKKWPLIIDPQFQALNWLKNRPNMEVMKASQKFEWVVKRLSTCMSSGIPVILSDIGEVIDDRLSPLLKKDVIMKGSQQFIQFGGEMVYMTKSFSFCMVTEFNKPHYTPAICSLLTIINFSVP